MNIPLSNSDRNARYLYRIDTRVGPIGRGYYYTCGRLRFGVSHYTRRDVDVNFGLSDRLGVLTLDEVSQQIKEAIRQ